MSTGPAGTRDRRALREMAVAVLLLLLAGAMWPATSGFGSESRAYVRSLLVLLVVLTALHLAREALVWLRRVPRAASSPPDGERMSRAQMRRFVVLCLGTAGYFLAIVAVGFPLPTLAFLVLMVGFSTDTLTARASLRRVVLFGVPVALVYSAVRFGLGVSLPSGALL